jgi:hypothetical protein
MSIGPEEVGIATGERERPKDRNTTLRAIFFNSLQAASWVSG